jgi:hypothetical protein
VAVIGAVFYNVPGRLLPARLPRLCLDGAFDVSAETHWHPRRSLVKDTVHKPNQSWMNGPFSLLLAAEWAIHPGMVAARKEAYPGIARKSVGP